MALLQVALDVVDLRRALEIAMEIAAATGCEGVWLEAGTPLIKSWGALAIKLLKNSTGCFVVADTKTVDAAEVEVEAMGEAGADAVTVLGLAADETIKSAVEAARRRGVAIMVDMISHPDPLSRALEVRAMGIDYVIYHVGIDVQRHRGITARGLLAEAARIKREAGLRIAVAGGLKLDDLAEVVRAGADVAIVGSAITRSQRPGEAARAMLDELRRASQAASPS
ncbi:MAG: orotidine 5'-phosphate decarboxylase / HUMPS family protein [Desulfurococcaceae archaeon]